MEHSREPSRSTELFILTNRTVKVSGGGQDEG